MRSVCETSGHNGIEYYEDMAQSQTRTRSRLDDSTELDVELAMEYFEPRKSARNPALSHLDRRDVKDLLHKIRTNHPDTIILKVL